MHDGGWVRPPGWKRDGRWCPVTLAWKRSGLTCWGPLILFVSLYTGSFFFVAAAGDDGDVCWNTETYSSRSWFVKVSISNGSNEATGQLQSSVRPNRSIGPVALINSFPTSTLATFFFFLALSYSIGVDVSYWKQCPIVLMSMFSFN